MAQKLNGAVSFQMIFKELYTQAIISQGNGVLGIFLSDSTKTDFLKKSYVDISQVKAEDWTDKNYKYLKDLAFKGTPRKVVVYRIDEAESPEAGYLDMTHLNEVYRLASEECDYFAYPGGTTEEQQALVEMVKKDRKVDKILNPLQKTIKFSTAGVTAPDNPFILTTNQWRKVNETKYTAVEYALCLASIAAGLGISGSMTYYKEPWVEEAQFIEDINQAVGDGYLVTVPQTDGDNIIYRLERGVNSMTTPTETQGRTFTKVRLIAIMDQCLKDIKYTYVNYYIGKRDNHYENKALFCSAVNGYLLGFMKDGYLDSNYLNKMVIDIDTQKKWAFENGKISEDEMLTMNEYEALRLNTKDQGFYKIKEFTPVDVMEDAVVEVEVI
ncbi:MAG: phage tail sheath C-terminal domain-containing protein [Cetobacterium sp.]